MTVHECSEARFLEDVKDHQMIILRDDGTERHIRFREPGTYCFHFDLITWKGHLCIAGDCGTYVFQRVEDMFEFFRDEKIGRPDSGKMRINPQYWGEKLQSIATNGGYEEHSGEKLKTAVKEYFDQHFEAEISEDDLVLQNPAYFDRTEAKARAARRAAIWEEIEQDIMIYADDAHRGPTAVYDFEHDGFHFQDFFERRIVDYTFHYIWNLYAIVWGIQQYDKAKEPAAKSTVTI